MDESQEPEMRQCPYDKSHRILPIRFQKHIIKCKKNHPGVKKSICPFDVSHILDPVEMDEHVKSCPKRNTYELFKYSEGEATGGPDLLANSKITAPQHIADVESWDDEPDVPTYNPNNYIMNAPVIRTIQEVSKSQKKKFREEERLRFLNFDNNQ